MAWSDLGGDPAPGDAAAVGRLGRRFGRFAADVSEQATLLRRIAEAAGTGSWTGEAAATVRPRVAELPDRLTTVASSFGDAGEALRRYETQLRLAQEDAATIVRRAARALDDERAAERDARCRLLRATAEADVASTPFSLSHALAREGLHPSPRSGIGLDVWVGGTLVGGRLTTTDWDWARSRTESCLRDAATLRERVDRQACDAAARLDEAGASAFGRSSAWWESVAAFVVDLGLDIAVALEDVAGAVSVAAGLLSLATVWCPPLSGAFATTALVSSGVALACSVATLVGGRGSPSDVGWNALGVATGGLGRALSSAARAVHVGAGTGGARTMTATVRADVTRVADLRQDDVVRGVVSYFSGDGSAAVAALNTTNAAVGALSTGWDIRRQRVAATGHATLRRAATRGRPVAR